METAVHPESRLPDVGVSIFAVMTRLANEHGAINLSQGFPDFDGDPDLVATVHRHMRAGHNQYAPMPGILALREALAHEDRPTLRRGATTRPPRSPSRRAPPRPSSTSSPPSSAPATRSSSSSRPTTPTCPVIRLNGGIPRFVTLRAPDYRIDWDEVRARPHAPHAAAHRQFAAQPDRERSCRPAISTQLATVLDGSRVIVLPTRSTSTSSSTAAATRASPATRHLRARSCVVSSFGKTYHTTGWKVGYVTAPAPLTAEIQRIHQFVTFATNTPVQMAYAEFTERRGSLRRPRDVLPGQAGSVPRRCIEGSRFTPVPVPRHVLPDPRLLGHQRRSPTRTSP